MGVVELKDLILDADVDLFVARDDERIVGMGALYFIRKIGKCNAYIEDVIVDEAYRGQGLGEKLVRALIETAKQKGVRSITLTSRSERVAAHKLYEKLGFKTKETNVFQLKF
jgi:ribosomal protein S18 acetylase RimI-like enzyme